MIHLVFLATAVAGPCVGAAAEAGGRVAVAAALGQQRQGQQRLVMPGIEVDRLVETVLGAAAVAGRLADHPHQIIRRGAGALEPKVLLAGGDRLGVPAPVGQLGGLIQQRRFEPDGRDRGL